MARQPRIEFPGAFYHVMCRGDRREPIFEDDGDRDMFLHTLSECCERSGWRIYAWVLMSNHYHWVLQTPEANLVAGMKWFQNTYTRRLNTRHSLWGHVFGGRYKAIVVDSSGGGYLETLMDYVHLNPVRAGLVRSDSGKGLLDFRWTSLAQGYGVPASQRPVWLAAQEGLALFGYRDEARDRRKFVERLEERALEDGGHVDGPHSGLQNTLQRGWYWGSQEFREKMLKLAQRVSSNRNYRTSQLGREKDRKDGQFWIQKAAEHFGISSNSFREAPREARLAAAWAIHLKTNQPQKWVADTLGFHSAANVSQQVRRIDSPAPPPSTTNPLWKKWRTFVNNCWLTPFALATSLLALSEVPIHAAAHTWNVTGTGIWNLDGNWNGGVPTASGTAVIDNSGTAVLGTGVSGTYGTLYTGSSSAGTINITEGLLTGATAFLGFRGGSLGTATVTSGTWSNSGILYVGESGAGVLSVIGGSVSNTIGFIGHLAGSSGTATVTSGTWTNSGDLYVGQTGKGVLKIDSGLVTNTVGYIGFDPGNSGTATVTGGTWSNSDLLCVGVYGNGFLNVNGGSVSSAAGYIGYNMGTSSTATVTSGTWSNSGSLYVGVYRNGTLHVDGGSVSNTVGYLGHNVGSSGTATVTSGTWTNSSGLFVGNSGTGVLNVSGGLVSVTGTVTAGNLATGVGSITLSGSNGNRGVLWTSQIREGSGTGTVDFHGGILQAGANQNDFLSGFEAGDVTIGAGGAFIDSNGFAIRIAAPMDGSGRLTKQGAGTLTLSGSNSYSGGTTVSSGTLVAVHNHAVGSGVVNIEGGTFTIDDTVTITNDIVFTGAGNVVRELASGANLAGTLSVRSDLGGRDTSATLLSGTTSSATSLLVSFSATSSATNDEIRDSDVFMLSGVPVVSGSETDVFVLQLSMTDVDSGSYLGWLNADNAWVNAVEGNTNGSSTFVAGAWNASYGLGTYGVDVANNTVWAVLNHNSEFAIIPEPGSGALFAAGALVFVIRRRRPNTCEPLP